MVGEIKRCRSYRADDIFFPIEIQKYTIQKFAIFLKFIKEKKYNLSPRDLY